MNPLESLWFGTKLGLCGYKVLIGIIAITIIMHWSRYWVFERAVGIIENKAELRPMVYCENILIPHCPKDIKSSAFSLDVAGINSLPCKLCWRQCIIGYHWIWLEVIGWDIGNMEHAFTPCLAMDRWRFSKILNPNIDINGAIPCRRIVWCVSCNPSPLVQSPALSHFVQLPLQNIVLISHGTKLALHGLQLTDGNLGSFGHFTILKPEYNDASHPAENSNNFDPIFKTFESAFFLLVGGTGCAEIAWGWLRIKWEYRSGNNGIDWFVIAIFFCGCGLWGLTLLYILPWLTSM